MTTSQTREPDRFHLAHHVVGRLCDRGWFSAPQVAVAVYYGAMEIHPQQRKRIRELLDEYVEAGILGRNDQIAKCPLYQHLNTSAEEVDETAVLEFETHASRIWDFMAKFLIQQIERDLDRLVPRNVAPSSFTKDGRLLPAIPTGKSHFMWDRLIDPDTPSALGYVRKPDRDHSD